MNRKTVYPVLAFLFCISVYAQVENGTADLPKGYLEVELGMDLEELKTALKAHPYLLYRGDPDVSLLANREEILVQCTGQDFIERGIFQLFGNRVYLISLILDTDRIDYYTMYMDLRSKYGEPDSISPAAAVWQNGTVRLSLEKPLTVKYLDISAFETMLEESGTGESLEKKGREDFLEGF